MYYKIEDDGQLELHVVKSEQKTLETRIVTWLRLMVLFIISLVVFSTIIINNRNTTKSIDIDIKSSSSSNSSSRRSSSNSGSSDGNDINIALIGDSITDRPWTNYDLKAKIEKQVSRDVKLFKYASSGSKIKDTLGQIDNTLNECKPKYVILLWHSDSSDVDESKMTSEEIVLLRNNYTNDLKEFCSRVINYGAILAIAGPELLGDGYVKIGLAKRNYNKTDMFEAYKKINQEVAALFDLPYIDVRQAFLDASRYWPFAMGFVTTDGEHPNDRGSTIIADLFSKQINEWTNYSMPTTKSSIFSSAKMLLVIVISLFIVIPIYSYRSFISSRQLSAYNRLDYETNTEMTTSSSSSKDYVKMV